MSPRAEYGSDGPRGRGDRADPWPEAFGAHATDLADAVFLAALRRARADTRRREPPRDADEEPPHPVTESGRDPAAGSAEGGGERADASTWEVDAAPSGVGDGTRPGHRWPRPVSPGRRSSQRYLGPRRPERRARERPERRRGRRWARRSTRCIFPATRRPAGSRGPGSARVRAP
ncbi:hypothetical protein BJF83_14065 [Nocardiopsis sp. CNR-923]|nr:hypothetical protein BJF83_14065 [Nocardiopsis sp. CNR-923]